MLKGLGQIMLQENAATGILFLTGIFYGSLAMGIGAIVAVFTGTMTAKIFGYDKAEIESGLYGFSAALVGVALTFYYKPVFAIWVSVVIGSALAAMLQHWFIVRKIPVFTLPFILITWVCMFQFQNLYPVEPSVLSGAAASNVQDFTFALRGFGQVIFQGSVFAGAAFCIGVFVSSPISSLYGIAAALLAAVLAFLCSAPGAGIEMGLFSYNAVLCAIVFAGNKTTDGVWVFVSVVLSVGISLIMAHYNLTQLTFPFVAASCVSLAAKNLVMTSRWA